MNHIILAFVVFLALFSGMAQANTIVVEDLTGSLTAEDLVSLLLGENSTVVVSNITITGSNLAIGKFTNGGSLEFDTGIVMSTGKVSEIPEGVIADDAYLGTDFSNTGDEDLKNLSGFDNFDAIILEFDFMTEYDSITFNYRIASTEPFGGEYADVFGLFVNGVNVALLPDGEIVTIPNIDPSGPYYEEGPFNTSFDRGFESPQGFSIVLTAVADVEPNTLNHMKFAIADVVDGDYDSAVFIEGGSFVSNTLPDAPTSPLSEGETNPTSVANLNPEFSWTFSDPDIGDTQSAYQIQVGTSEGESDMWDSGKIISSSSTDISYAGSDLELNTTYYWRVRTWDNNNAAGPYCEDQTFTTAESEGPISPPVADFTSNVTSGTVPLVVNFTDTSTESPTSWDWDFGDGNFSIDQHPTHTYVTAGTYTVSLNATNGGGYSVTTKTDYITVTEQVATTVNASSTLVTYNENDDMIVDPGINVSGSSIFTSARVYIADGYVEGEDFLRFTNTSSINGSFDYSTGVLSLSGSGGAADYQEAFRNVRYENINDNPNITNRNITFVLGDNALYFQGTGHYYEFVQHSLITWTDAKVAAEGRYLSGMQGYLATITSQEENDFITSKIQGEAWIGASDAASERTWRWVTGPEGLEDSGSGRHFFTQTGDAPNGGGFAVGGYYSNWVSGEPNAWPPEGEDYAHLRSNGEWNDYADYNDGIKGYFVEYGGMPDEPIPQLTATITVSIHSINDAPSMPGNFANPTSGQSIERGSTINVTWNESTDPENDAITYDLWYYNGTWSQIAGMLDVTNYEFTIPIDNVDTATLKVYANDSLDSSPENNVTFNLMSIMPGSNFTADVTSGLAPLTVNFTYDPSHYPTGLVWNFGDGSNSTEQNPMHTYFIPGTYTVSLNASNLGGYNITTKTAYITAAYVPVANFTADITSGAVPLTVNFTDTSQNDPAGWFWNFGDGTNSTEQNPTHVYASVGTYTVSLNVTNVGGSNTSTQINYISAAEIPVASFTANITSGTVPLTVNFTDQSEHSPTSWFWDFGDGTSSTEQNPLHTYTSSGTFIVNLTATNIGGSNISTQIIITDVVPVASFTANATSGALPLSVAFTDQSTNATGWYWEFGDGNISTVQNPTHTYTAVGIYSVNLTAINTISGNDTLTRTAYINAAIAPVSAFIASVTSGTAPLTVSFNDNSINTPTAWAWDFGDGATSTAQNPTHTYTSAGTYTVSLNASNVGGYNISTGTAYITVGSASSGSGTRASVSPGQPPENVASTYTSVKHVMGGTSVEYDLSGTGSPVLGISFDAKDNEGIVVVKVQVLSDRPEGVSVPPGKQYQLMSIDVGSEGTISSHNADNIRINFKVSWDWIKENNIDPSTIRLTRYHDGEWQELPTGKVSDDGQFIHFVAETPGFSIFSVVGEELVLAREGANDVPLVFAEEALDVSTTSEDKKMPGFTGLMGMLFVAVACLVRRRSGL